MNGGTYDIDDPVHCRTGSLETYVFNRLQAYIVHCRTGSLEMHTLICTKTHTVHCRTGSLEISVCTLQE